MGTLGEVHGDGDELLTTHMPAHLNCVVLH